MAEATEFAVNTEPDKPNGHGTAAPVHAGDTFRHCCDAWRREVMAFASSRIQADLELPGLFANCHTLADVMKVQQEWAAAATKAYLAESDTLTKLSTTAMNEGLAAWLSTFKAATTPDARA